MRFHVCRLQDLKRSRNLGFPDYVP